MLISYQESTVDKLLTRYIDYAKQLRLVDTFWENYIVLSDIYEIIDENKSIGFFSIFKSENLLTSFHIDYQQQTEINQFNYFKHSQAIFSEILEQFGIVSAFVVTNDEQMLSLCMDFQRKTKEISPAVEMQAYFFDYTTTDVREPEFPASTLKLAEESDIPELESLDFFYNLDLNNPADVKYVLRDDFGELLGAGHIQTMRFAPWWGTCGMVVAPNHRKKGVGRSIILHLKDIVKASGLTPIAGCWYYNHNSRYTLESCGFTSKTRFLKVHFK